MNRALALAAILFTLAGIARAVPFESYTWKNVAIHGGGFVTGIITHPAEKGLIYCRTDIGGAYRWEAGEQRWIPLNDWVSQEEFNLLGIESLAIDPSDPNRLYIAAGTYTHLPDKTAILRSSDRGRTFARTDMPLRMGGNDGGRPVGERLAVDPRDGRILYFGSRQDGLWKSADCGETWKKVESFPAIATSPSARSGTSEWTWAVGIAFVQFSPAGAATDRPTPVYAAVCTKETSLYRSIDGGETWHAVKDQPTGLRPNHAALASDGWLYISYGDEPGPHVMNDGALWKLHTKTGQWVDVTPVRPGGKDRFGYSGATVDPRNPNVVLTCTFCRWAKKDQVFRSIDGGKTWEGILRDEGTGKALAVFDPSSSPYAGSLDPHWLGDIELDPFDPDHAMFVTGYGIWGCHNLTAADRREPTRWTFDNRGIEEIACQDLVSPPEGPPLVSVIGDFDGFRHDDLDTPPRRGRHQPSIGSTSHIDFAEHRPSTMVRMGDGKGFVSHDGAQTWRAFAAQDDKPSGGTIALSADGGVILWSPRNVAARYSTDDGATWTKCGGVPQGADVVADRAADRTFYAWHKENATLYASTDGGTTFAKRGEKLPNTERQRFRAVPGREGDLWMAVEKGGLYHATDGGRSFARIPSINNACTLGFGKAAPGRDYPAIYLVATIDGVTGVFRSDDAGNSWVRINDDQHQYGWIGHVVIGDPRIYGRVYLGTNGRGILYAEPTRKGP